MSEPALKTTGEIEQALKEFNQTFQLIQNEIGRVIVGMKEVVHGVLTSMFAGGHVLLEGSPGLGKTRLVRTVASTLGLTFKRIQFTPDLMPSDVTGTQVLTENEQGKRTFVFKPGPIFGNIILADEINRSTPKTQSALLEAMEEKQITVLGETYQLPKPFFVLATQNPIELEGTYPLPEAQLDRFLLKLNVKSPDSKELKEILNRTTGTIVPEARCVIDERSIVATIERMRMLVREVTVADPFQEILVRMFQGLDPNSQYATEMVKTYVRFGPGPRGAQSVLLAAKVRALCDSRINLSFEDIKEVIIPALRHRLILTFQAEADSVTADQILEQIRNAK